MAEYGLKIKAGEKNHILLYLTTNQTYFKATLVKVLQSFKFSIVNILVYVQY